MQSGTFCLWSARQRPLTRWLKLWSGRSGTPLETIQCLSPSGELRGHMSNNIEKYYRQQMALLPCVMTMTARGVRVQDGLRQERLRALQAEATRIRDDVLPIVEGVADRLQER